MSEPVNQINHAEVIKKALDTGGHAHRCGVEWSYACDCGAGTTIESGYASLAAMQKELEEAKASDTESISLYRNCRDRADAQAERIARLEEALDLAREVQAVCIEDDCEGPHYLGADLYAKFVSANLSRAALTPPTP